MKTIAKAFKRHRFLKTIAVAALASLSTHPLFSATGTEIGSQQLGKPSL